MSENLVEKKLSAARTRLILDKPFLGALVLRLPLVPANPAWCKSAVSDAKKLYYNSEYIAALTIEETEFVLAKQALHCALLHFARRQHRSKQRWDIACDFAVNPILVNEDLKPPAGILIEKKFEGMTAEEIYPCLDEFENEDSEFEQPQTPRSSAAQNQQQGTHELSPEETTVADRPSPLTVQEEEALAVQWQQRLAGAAQLAKQAGKLSGSMARLADYFIQPRLPWRMLLARYLTSVARDDYSYSRPSSRRGDPAIFPSLRSTQTNVIVALDTSGSIGDQEMNDFLSEIDAIKGQLRARLTLLACDAALSSDGPWLFEPWEEFKLPRSFVGGGGTDFCPVFTWVDRQDIQPDLLLYFTDAQGSFPAAPPTYPVIWLVKGKEPVPWGQRVQLN